MGRRSGRAAAKRAAVALETAPRILDDGDEPMIDAPMSEPEPEPEPEPQSEPEPEPEPDEDAEPGEQHGDEEDEAAEDNAAGDATEDTADEAANGEGDEDGEEEGEEEEEGEGEGEEEQVEAEEGGEEEASTEKPASPLQPSSQRRRLGRPPKNRLSGWDQATAATPERDPAGTPRRGRGRGGWRGRGGRKGGPAPPRMDQIIDKDGNTAPIADDELVLPEDPEGETKVDRLGNLQDGREYRCRTFTVLGRGARLYMLSTEPARCVGFRDSYLFFTKHLRLYKCIVDDEEKRDMIERDIIPHSYKGRSIAVVTARSVFREFGARIVVGGRRIIDDYKVAVARAEGAVEGAIADPSDHFVPSEPYNKNQYVAWHGASAVYHTNNMPAPAPAGKPEPKKRRINMNDVSWMLEHARSASAFNTWLTESRIRVLKGSYDIHTNLVHYPASVQPTYAIFQQVAPAVDDGGDSNPGNANTGRANNADAAADTDAAAEPSLSLPATSGPFPRLPPKVSRNYLVTDTYFYSPQGGVAASALDNLDPAPRDDFLAPFRGLGAVPDDVKELLPAECRAAFDVALARETEWKTGWREMEDKQQRERVRPIIDKAVMPMSVPLQNQ